MDQPFTSELLNQSVIGAALREARESQSLSIDDVRARLHLSDRQIIALETDDFNQFGSAMLVRGFIKSYAQFLSLNPEPLLDAYREQYPQDEIQSIEYKSAYINRPQSSGIGKFLTLMLGLFTILASLAWVGYKVWVYQQTTNSAIASEPTSAMNKDALTQALPDDGLTVDRHEISASAGAIVTDIELPKSNEPKLTQGAQLNPVMPEIKKTTDKGLDLSRSLETTNSEAANISPVKTPVESGKVRVRLVLTGSSWIGVQDKTGRTVFSKLAKAGTEEFVEGIPPLKFHIGNASATQVIFNGENIDLTATTFNNMARITLGDQ